MLQRILVLYSVALFTPIIARCQLQPIGQWREHLPYQSVLHVTATNDKIWAATPYSIFSVDLTDQSIERFSKINGLTETGISAIGAGTTGEPIVITYNNSNIDVLSGNKVTNINALKNLSAAGDKTIYSMLIYNQQALLATG